ncbi:hypothetical protein JOC24_002300 [Streptomyces sp. HB132]|nr:hypothetical protein [Streptomyces sp. HB132]
MHEVDLPAVARTVSTARTAVADTRARARVRAGRATDRDLPEVPAHPTASGTGCRVRQGGAFLT